MTNKIFNTKFYLWFETITLFLALLLPFASQQSYLSINLQFTWHSWHMLLAPITCLISSIPLDISEGFLYYTGLAAYLVLFCAFIISMASLIKKKNICHIFILFSQLFILIIEVAFWVIFKSGSYVGIPHIGFFVNIIGIIISICFILYTHRDKLPKIQFKHKPTKSERIAQLEQQVAELKDNSKSTLD